MKARLIRDMPTLERKGGKIIRNPNGKPTGTEINDPNAYMLVRQGVAEPADEECAKAAGMTPEAFENAKYAYERTAKGIQPEDFEAYKQGLMVGYKPDGKDGDSWLPGPKWTEGCEAEYYESLEPEDDDDE